MTDPQCQTDCSGRHHEEACLGCPRCGARLYALVAHEWRHSAAHYFYSQEPIHETPPGLTDCPACGAALQRLR